MKEIKEKKTENSTVTNYKPVTEDKTISPERCVENADLIQSDVIEIESVKEKQESLPNKSYGKNDVKFEEDPDRLQCWAKYPNMPGFHHFSADNMDTSAPTAVLWFINMIQMQLDQSHDITIAVESRKEDNQ